MGKSDNSSPSSNNRNTNPSRSRSQSPSRRTSVSGNNNGVNPRHSGVSFNNAVPRAMPPRSVSNDGDSDVLPRPLPINIDGSNVQIDKTVDFEMIGGLDKNIKMLKEIILLPLFSPDIFAKLHINPVRGVLFHGPPGTGKTMMARALYNEASRSGKQVAFFMRKGADCLSKWVGETEKHLMDLFEEAQKRQPSIIFFDEIDGLAPVRSSKQDHIHSSIVSTLLSLMDGIDQRGNVIVIGATNRIDCVDPALRRPGRFDREILFSLPTTSARKNILRKRTMSWGPEFEDDDHLQELAQLLNGWSGADIDALCGQAFYNAFERKFPSFLNGTEQQAIANRSLNTLRIKMEDVRLAIKKITPTGARNGIIFGRPIPAKEKILLQENYKRAHDALHRLLPPDFEIRDPDVQSPDNMDSQIAMSMMNYIELPRLLLAGQPGNGQLHFVCPALLFELNEYTIHTISFSVYDADGIQGIENIFNAAEAYPPSVIFVPSVDTFWSHVCQATQFLFYQRVSTMSKPVLVLATCDVMADKLPTQLKELFNQNVVTSFSPSDQLRFNYFHYFIVVDLIQMLRGNPTIPLEPTVTRKLNILLNDIVRSTKEMPVCRISEMRSYLASHILIFSLNNPDSSEVQFINKIDSLYREFMRNV